MDSKNKKKLPAHIIYTYHQIPILFENDEIGKIFGLPDPISLEKDLDLFCKTIQIEKSEYRKFLRTI